MEEASEQIIRGIEQPENEEKSEKNQRLSAESGSSILNQRRSEEESLTDSEKQKKRNSDLQACIDQCSENLGDMLNQMEKVVSITYLLLASSYIIF